jgi:phospholipase C
MSKKEFGRREFLAGGIGAAATIAMARREHLRRVGHELVKQAASVEPAGSSLSSIKHVVFLMQENRSFDNYFGAMGGVNGFNNFDGSSPVWNQSWPGSGHDSTLMPFHLNPDNQGECTYDLSHAWTAQHSCWDNGAMDAFVSTHTSGLYEGDVGSYNADMGTLTMGYYEENDIPFYWDLAQKFTVCDNYFCSVLGPTHPNRLMQVSGSLDPSGSAGGPILVTNSDSALQFSCSWKTMPELLTENGISWKFYNPHGPLYQPASSPGGLWVSDNILLYFKQFEKAAADPTTFKNAFRQYGPLVAGGLTSPTGMNDFLRDARSGRLPQVSWVIPPDGYDEHPPAPPVLGEWFTSKVIKALMSNKKTWASTVLFIMYDENDGWFDHVAPTTAPSGTPGEHVTVDPLPSSAGGVAGPIGLGFRVPMIVVSPFSVSSIGAGTGSSGWVCSDLFDHTSQLKFIEKVFLSPGTIMGTGGLNMSQWRYDTVGDLTSALPLISSPVTKKPKLLPTSPSENVSPVSNCSVGELLESSPKNPTPYPVPSPQVAPTTGSQSFTPTPT